jgi:MFS family permease
MSDRRGRLFPLRRGLVAAGIVVLTITLPQAALPLAVLIIVTTIAFGLFWAPAMAMVSDTAEQLGLALGFAFALVNLAWALGQVAGAGFGGVTAKATTDLVPLAVVSGLCLVTFLALRGRESVAAPYTGHGAPITEPVAGTRS